MKKAMIVFFILSIAVNVSAKRQAEMDSLLISTREHLQAGIDEWDVIKMLQARAQFEKMISEYPDPWLVRYYIGYADSKIFAYYHGKKDLDLARLYADAGIDHLKKAVRQKKDFAEGYVMMASLIAQKVALNPISMISRGGKLNRMVNKALDIDPDNPRAVLISGELDYYKPGILGGGREKSAEQLRRAIELFESFELPSAVWPDWGHEEPYAFLGMIAMDEGRYDEAMEHFDKALEIYPDFGWVSKDLMKKLKKKMAEAGQADIEG